MRSSSSMRTPETPWVSERSRAASTARVASASSSLPRPQPWKVNRCCGSASTCDSGTATTQESP